MSTENVEVFNRYYGNGVATQFSIGFPYLKREFVKVYLYKKDTDEEKVLNSDQFSFVNDTTIQYPVLSTDEILKEGDILTIQRETELGSEFEFDNQRRLFPVEVMNADDLAFQQIQELSREIKRAVRVNPTAAETPEELLQTVYDKLDSATEIAGDAISAANQAQTAADNATAAVNSAEQTLANVTAYVDSAKVEIDSAVAQAKADVNSAIDEATTDISNIVSNAEGSITNIAVTEANKAIANAAQEATDMATASLNSYVDGTVKPSLQTYVDQAQEDANSAATSMEQAALSATAASADADNAAESAGLAANSATEASNSEEKAAEYLQQIGNKITTVEGSIGDIGIAPFGIDETQNKRRYLNGQVISQAQFVSFTNKLKSIIRTYPSLAVSETNWQATVTNSKLGQCGKFVIDDTLGTIRLPKVVNIQGLQDLALMGSIKAESLPNITGNIHYHCYNESANTNGAFWLKGGLSKAGTASDGTPSIVHFDASRSSSTYQDNAPVQQEAIQYPYFIQVATGVEESVDVTREIELNNPFSLLDYKWSEYEITNASWLLSNGQFNSGATYPAVYELLLKIKNGTETKDGVSVKLSTEAYADTDFVLNTAEETFRLPIKVKQKFLNAINGNMPVVGNGSTITVENLKTEQNGILTVNSPTGQTAARGYLIPAGGSNWAIGSSVGITTNPEKSGLIAKISQSEVSDLYLYFYVGETIQDANVINASGVLTRVADLSDSYISGLGMPSGKYIDLTLGASGSSYTAPANGWMFLDKSASSTNQHASLINVSKSFGTTENISASGATCRILIPVEKGDIVEVRYNAGGRTSAFRFIYAEGEK